MPDGAYASRSSSQRVPVPATSLPESAMISRSRRTSGESGNHTPPSSARQLGSREGRTAIGRGSRAGGSIWTFAFLAALGSSFRTWLTGEWWPLLASATQTGQQAECGRRRAKTHVCSFAGHQVTITICYRG